MQSAEFDYRRDDPLRYRHRRALRVLTIAAMAVVALCVVGSAAARPQRAHPGDALGGVTLRSGANGRAVRELELALAWHGFPSGAIDGHFGAHVARAVRRFQRAGGLRADGIAGPATIELLRATPPSARDSTRLAPSRAGRRRVRAPRRPLPRRHRSALGRRSTGRRGCAGACDLGRRPSRRLGEPRHDRARERRAHDVRAPLGDLRPRRRMGCRRHGRRSRRFDRRRNGPASALRGSPRRCGDRSPSRPRAHSGERTHAFVPVAPAGW